MNTRAASLLASLALGVAALTGCSVHANGAAGDLNNRVPMAQAQPAEPGSSTGGQVIVTSLSQAQFKAQSGAGTCTDADGLTYCQDLESQEQGATVGWTVFISVPQDTVDATLGITGTGFEYRADVHASHGYAKVVWVSPGFPASDVLTTDAEISLEDGGAYGVTGNATLDSGSSTYDEQLVVSVS
jgi:hypothetical protein